MVLVDVELLLWKDIVMFARDSHPRPLIVEIGTADSAEVVEETRVVGVDTYLLRPVSFNEIYESVACLTRVGR